MSKRAPKDSKWTPEQWDGISITGKSLLVSAAAGSGKTAVLAERCAFLVYDADEKCDVDELLVVTFTDAGAAEMRQRIQASLRDRLKRDDSPRLLRQLALVEHAQISTLHAFCAKILRQHFHLLELDPNFTVLDGDEAMLLRAEVARDLLAKRYEDDSTGQFQSFIDSYGDGDDEKLVKQITRSHELLCSLVAPRQWMKTARDRIAEACEKPLEESAMGRELLKVIESRVAEVRRRCSEAIDGIKRLSFPKYMPLLSEYESILKHFEDVLRTAGLDSLVSEFQVPWPKLPPIASGTPNKEAAMALVDSVRCELKEGQLFELLQFTSQQWLDGLKSMRPHAEMFLELLEQFAERYRTEKQMARVVDFSDLERMALRALSEKGKPSRVAQLLHQQFRHVLVDEYQDINEVQDAILSLVSRECCGGEIEANLFCVGDVKQSIYRFRLAEPARFLARHKQFKSDGARGVVVDLQKNFRSRAPLLDVLNNVFGKLMTEAATEIEYDQKHHLVAGADYVADTNCFAGAPVELHLLPDKIDVAMHADESTNGDDEIEPERAEREALLIAQRIREIMPTMQVMEKQADEKLAARKIRYGDIVILLRSMKFKCDQYAEILRRSGIPVHSESATGFFESMEVRDILSLLAILDNQRQDIPLAGVLRSPLTALPDAEDNLARVRMAYREKDVPFHLAVVRYASEQDDELAARLRDFLVDLTKWREMAQRRPLAEVIWKIYSDTGYLAFCEGLDDGEQRKANLIDLHERARQFGTFQRQGVARFLKFLESLESESDLGQPSIAAEADDVVRIMSVHRSKGLEFPVVILPDLGKRMNLSDCHGSILLDRKAFLGMSVVDEERRIRYPSLASVLVSNQLLQQSLAEELRVMYVAMTRAREHLILVGTCKPTAGEEWLNQWAGHEGAFRADVVLGARKMLDWIGPVAAAMAADKSPGIRVVEHTADEVASWPSPESLRPSKNDRLEMLARLEALYPAPAKDADAEKIIERLTTKYPFEELTKLKAVESATEIAKRDHVRTPGERLQLPKSISVDMAMDASDVGTATHIVLQHVDFNRRCDVDDLRAQIEQLVERRLLSPTHAKAVDVESICWLVGSPIGQRLREHVKTLRRELALNFILPTDADISKHADCVMVRGRIDVLIETPAGLEIVDYKTDRVPVETFEARADSYGPQLTMYRQAIQKITGKPVVQTHLVFLSARQVRTTN